MKTTLFMPVKNEIEGLRHILPRIKSEWVDEIIAVDGDSTDGTREFLESKGVKVIRQSEPGLCAAYWECFAVATGDIIIPFSPDNNSIPELLPELIAEMKKGNHMVIVSRYYKDAKSEDDDFITAFGNWLFTKTINVLFRANYTDVLVMYRAFRLDLIKELEIDCRKIPAIEAQLAIRCAKAKYPVADIAGDEPKRIGGVRKMSPIYNGSTILYMIVRELFCWHGKKMKKPLRAS